MGHMDMDMGMEAAAEDEGQSGAAVRGCSAVGCTSTVASVLVGSSVGAVCAVATLMLIDRLLKQTTFGAS